MRAHHWIRPDARLRSVVLLVTGSLNFPDFLSIFRRLRTFTKFRVTADQVVVSIGSQARLFLYVFYHFAFHFYPSKAID